MLKLFGVPARSYELTSKNGKKSVLIVSFLMARPQTVDIEGAVKAAIPGIKAVRLKWIMRRMLNAFLAVRPTADTSNPIVSKTGVTMWYRFYDLKSDTGFFSHRLPTDNPAGAGRQYDLMDIEPERRYSYGWCGSYGTVLINYGESVGYFKRFFEQLAFLVVINIGRRLLETVF